MIVNRKGQAASGMSWFVATIVIFVMTAVFLFLVGMISGLSGLTSANSRSTDPAVASAVVGEDLARNQLNSFLISSMQFSDRESVTVLDYIRGFDFSALKFESSSDGGRKVVGSNWFNETLFKEAQAFFKGQDNWGFYVSERLINNFEGVYYTTSPSRGFSDGKVTNYISFLSNAKKGQCADSLNYAHYQFISREGKKLYIWLCLGGGK